MDTSHALLPLDGQLLEAVEASTAARLAKVLDAALRWPPQPLAATRKALVGYRFLTRPEDFRAFVASKAAWAVRAFARCYAGTRVTPPQRVLEVELDWVREDLALGNSSREHAINDLIELIQGLDAMLVFQAAADTEYFSAARSQPLDAHERETVEAGLLRAYRRRHIAAGFNRREFSLLLRSFLSHAQRARLERELAPIIQPIWGEGTLNGFRVVAPGGAPGMTKQFAAPGMT